MVALFSFMKDPHKIFRTAVKQALDGQLTYDSSPVRVFDKKVEDESATTYVLLSSQTASPIDNFSKFYNNATLLLQVVTKSDWSVSTNILDDIGEQITEILQPSVPVNGLAAQSGFSINCLKIETSDEDDVQRSNSKYVIRKFIRLSAKIYQN